MFCGFQDVDVAMRASQLAKSFARGAQKVCRGLREGDLDGFGLRWRYRGAVK